MHPKRCALRGVGVAGLLLCGFIALRVPAACITDENPSIRTLDALVSQDATQALQEIRGRLDALEPAHSPEDVRRLAALYAVQAEAYSILELDTEARESAQKGLKLVPDLNDALHLGLMEVYAENVYDAEGINRAIASIATVLPSQPRGSVTHVCLLTTLGVLQLRQDRSDLAVLSLTQAWRASQDPALRTERIQAADSLSAVMSSVGDYKQALALNQEVIDWASARGASLKLSVARFMRGSVLMSMGEPAAAVEEYLRARELSVQLKDEQGIAFADLRICEEQIDTGQIKEARPRCEAARRVFAASHSTDVEKEAHTLLARIDLAEGHAAKALAALNQVLDRNGQDMPPRGVREIYKSRAESNAALHRYQDAYSDLNEYVRRYSAEITADRLKQAAALRARFETDREIERNESLRRALSVAQQRSDRQREQLRWIAFTSVASLLGLTLLTYILLASLRHRRQLVRLATIDGLTGVPNRRRTAELATAALEAAFTRQKPLTLALIDLDRFKAINDRCGHATGDHVLQEFARLSQQSIRASDILGRWGGEEFLLVLSDTTLDVALLIVERLRSLAARIELPLTGAELRVSISAGLAANADGIRSLDDLIARADSALYQAKNQGRDLVRVADQGLRAERAPGGTPPLDVMQA